jgi:hypothetical protein
MAGHLLACQACHRNSVTADSVRLAAPHCTNLQHTKACNTYSAKAMLHSAYKPEMHNASISDQLITLQRRKYLQCILFLLPEMVPCKLSRELRNAERLFFAAFDTRQIHGLQPCLHKQMPCSKTPLFSEGAVPALVRGT